jgi:hypothetical protein
MQIDVRASVNGGNMAPDFTESLYSLDPNTEPGNLYASPMTVPLDQLQGQPDVRIGFFAMMPPMSSEFHLDDIVVRGQDWVLVDSFSQNYLSMDADESMVAEFPLHEFMDDSDYRAVFILSPGGENLDNDIQIAEFSCGELVDVSVPGLLLGMYSNEPPVAYDAPRIMGTKIFNSGNLLADPITVSAHVGDLMTPFQDDMEQGEAMWMEIPPTANWMIQNTEKYSPPSAWGCSEDGMSYGELWHESLTTSAIDLSDPGMMNPTLSFWHSYDFETSDTGPVDGGNIKVSTDGMSWTVVSPADGYDGTLPPSKGGNPMANQDVFSGASEWHETFVNLSAYLGNPMVYIRFDMGTDDQPSMNAGWAVDNVRVDVFREYSPIPVDTPTISLQGSWDGSASVDVSTIPFTFPGPGIWTVWFTASNAQDDDFTNDIAYQTLEVGAAFDIPLQDGWNLISLPLEQTSTDPEIVLASIDGKWDNLYAYDPLSPAPWLSESPLKPDDMNDDISLNCAVGVWLHMTEPATLGVNGVVPISTDIPLYAGWNLVGYPSQNNQLASDALSGTNADIISIYNAAAPYLVEDRTDLSTVSMSPGDGYWIHVPADTVWTVNW